ncbi:hypothetical protein HK104_007819, partial [Borealophlyctis nickersoniae]
AEAFTGQGSDAEFSRSKNIFKYRVSPFVSGAVYLAYTYYVIRTIFIPHDARTVQSGAETTRSSFPDSWSNQGGWGKFGVTFIGLLFLVATLLQVMVAVTGSFKRDLYQNRLKPYPLWRHFVHALGHIGFMFRGLVFFLVAVLMFRSVGKANSDEDGHIDVNNSNSVTGKAIDSLKEETWGKVLLIFLG